MAMEERARVSARKRRVRAAMARSSDSSWTVRDTPVGLMVECNGFAVIDSETRLLSSPMFFQHKDSALMVVMKRKHAEVVQAKLTYVVSKG